MRSSIRLRTAAARVIALVCLSLTSALASAGDTPPVARVQEVHDTYFGTDVVDPYRWMETQGSAELAAWMKAQNAYTRGVFERLAKPRQQMLARIRTLQAGTAASLPSCMRAAVARRARPGTRPGGARTSSARSMT